MEELLIFAFQLLLEVLLQILVWFPWDLLLVLRDRNRDETSSGNRVLYAGGVTVGVAMGAFSLLLVRHAILSHPLARVANLVVAPLACAFLARAGARRRLRRGTHTDERFHFWFALLFALAFALVRFALAVRPA